MVNGEMVNGEYRISNTECRMRNGEWWMVSNLACLKWMPLSWVC